MFHFNKLGKLNPNCHSQFISNLLSTQLVTSPLRPRTPQLYSSQFITIEAHFTAICHQKSPCSSHSRGGPPQHKLFTPPPPNDFSQEALEIVPSTIPSSRPGSFRSSTNAMGPLASFLALIFLYFVGGPESRLGWGSRE